MVFILPSPSSNKSIATEFSSVAVTTNSGDAWQPSQHFYTTGSKCCTEIVNLNVRGTLLSDRACGPTQPASLWFRYPHT
jgi:hypothetical protein